VFSNIFQNKRVLVTGDTGFKGSWLALWLLSLRAEVYGYALPPKRKEDNYVVCDLQEKINHIDGDIRDFKTFGDYINKIQPDIIFHLAAQPLVMKSYKDPYETYSTNIMGTVNFFEAVRATSSVKVAINITSDKCYENKELTRGYRETDRMGGKDPYSASKGAVEIITSSYISSFFSNNQTANIASVRAGNVIGAGDWSENRIIPDYFKAKISNIPLMIRNPNSTRPWQHVLEPLSGYMNLAQLLYEKGKRFQGGYNFGPFEKRSYTVLGLIKEFSKYDELPEIDYGSSEKNLEANLLNLDISKAKQELGWKPVLNFNDNVKYCIEGYLSDIAGYPSRKNRLELINNYTKIAKKRGLPWARANS